MYGLEDRIKRLTTEICENLNEKYEKIENVEILKERLAFPCDLTTLEGFKAYTDKAVWSGSSFDDYALFKFTVKVPEIVQDNDGVKIEQVITPRDTDCFIINRLTISGGQCKLNIPDSYGVYIVTDGEGELVFKNIEFDEATLVHKHSGKKVRVTFGGVNYFLLWTKPQANAKYICLEPWHGVQDIVGSCYDITKKEGIIKLEGKGRYTSVHTIECIEAIDG